MNNESNNSVRNLLNLLKYLYLFCTFPVKYNKSIDKFESCPLLYFIPISILLVLMMFNSLYLMLSYDIIHNRVIQIEESFVTIVIMIVTWLKRKKMVMSLNLLINIDISLETFHIQTKYKLINQILPKTNY